MLNRGERQIADLSFFWQIWQIDVKDADDVNTLPKYVYVNRNREQE